MIALVSRWTIRVLVMVVALAAPFATPRPMVAAAQATQQVARTQSLPERLSDADFWKLVTDISEPGGYFRIADNFTSNEGEVGDIFSMLRATPVSGGVYVGVGPEQNLSYIAAIRPKMAFIIDIRRQAVMQHLLFKAVFELSRDRADFVSLLFSKPRPAGLDSTTAIQRIWDAFWYIPTDTVAGPKNYARILDHLTKTHGFAFTPDEVAQLKWVFDNFYTIGPVITTNGQAGGGGGGSALTFADLTGYSYDNVGQPQSFLSSEANFRTVKALHDKNLVVPVSGDFGGAKALRGIGTYLKQHDGTVSAYYVSNVEQYLFGDGTAAAFYANVATLPLNEATVFIRPYSIGRRGGSAVVPLCPIAAFLRAVNAGRIYSNEAALICPRG